MKIGIVCYPTYGGSGVVATELGLGLANKGHHIHFITYRRPPRLSAFNTNVFFHEVGKMEYPLFEYTPYETALASKMVDVVKYEKLDILHVHYAIPHAAVAYMAKKILADEGIHIPVITTLHGTDITLVGTDRTYSPVVEFSINHSDGVTAVSKHLAEMTYSGFNIKKEIRVIYNFIDFTRFKKVNKDHFKRAIAPEGEKILVHTSNFRKVKRVEDIVRVFYIVTKEVNAKLLLIGDGPERNHLEDLCRELKLCDHIRFLGKQDAIEELLSVADIFLLPSEQESFGLSALEAMACEVPVISSNAGGIPEVNVDGYTGYMTNIGDIDLMAERIIELLKDEEKLNQFRSNALNHAKTFDIEKILPQYEEYYQETIDYVRDKVMATV
jgi:N-acetyl-alpha-D-glucosaminyl L-malate synthase BshA